MLLDEEEYLAHYGTPRRSGRYAWGSGDNEVTTRNKDFLDKVKSHKAQGLKESEIATGMGFKSTTELRDKISLASREQKEAKRIQIQRLHESGMSPAAISRETGYPDRTVRTYINKADTEKVNIHRSTADMLKRQVEDKTYVDIGSGVENHLGVSAEKLRASVTLLKEEGYEVHRVGSPQVSTGKDTQMKVLCPPGTTQRDVFLNRDKIRLPTEYSDDGGRTLYGLHPPVSVNSKRISVRYGEEGGSKADGVIYVRPDVEDVSLGHARYAQVRVMVDGTHYIKGMAMYKDDLPDGVDLMFNTNKSATGNKLDAFKSLKDDPDNPFGSRISKQLTIDDGKGGKKVTSAMNIVHEEGDWKDWSDSIASQVLSKQDPAVAKSQLNMTYESRQAEFAELRNLTNPTVRKDRLIKFADGTDASAVTMDAHAMRRQSWKAILPLDQLSHTEVYAPTYDDGEPVALIRYPHGGTFEIPELTVNNRNPQGRRLLGNARDAIGINPEVAKRLSGADFDGDTVLVIPNRHRNIKSTPPLEDLKNFDPMIYRLPDDHPKIKPSTKQNEMGRISNLITDMTIKGAHPDEVARAVRHSMVVIDSENHHLNYKQSALDNGIAALKKEYQGKASAGASTLISRAGAEKRIPERQERRMTRGGPIDKDTGKRVYEPTNRTYTNKKTGEKVIRPQKVELLSVTEDAHTLASGSRMEAIYADHSNKLKALANEARREAVNTPRAKQSASAKKTYADQVASLDAKLQLAKRNRPLERQANILAQRVIRDRKEANPNMDSDTQKKIKFQALTEMRRRTGAEKHMIEFTQDEWDAIQAGAISQNKLEQMLAAANPDRVSELATPKYEKLMTPAKTNRARVMLEKGFTRAEVSRALGVSLTTLDVATVS